MKTEDFNRLVDQSDRRRKMMAFGKNREYTKEDQHDHLANFKNIARELKIPGVDGLVVWAIYMLKHKDAILNYVRKREVYSGEGIQGRFDDFLNYGDLGRGLVVDDIKEREAGAERQRAHPKPKRFCPNLDGCHKDGRCKTMEEHNGVPQ